MEAEIQHLSLVSAHAKKGLSSQIPPYCEKIDDVTGVRAFGNV